MKDGIIKNTKDSRLIKSTLPASYEELRTLMNNAGLPVDLLFNAAGWQQQPDFLNKINLLTDATAALLWPQGGAPTNPKINDALAELCTLRARIKTGSYVGTGTYGSSHKNTINCGINPKIALISPSPPINRYGATDGGLQSYLAHPAIAINGMTQGFLYDIGSGGYTTWTNITWGETALSWYNAADTGAQLNVSGITYYYAIIG